VGVTTADLTETGAGARFSAPSRTPRAPDSIWVRDLRHLPDSLLHHRRRQAARLQLRNLKPRSILFVCHGNICRSPFAAAVFTRESAAGTAGRISVASAGFMGPKRASPTKALAAGRRRGVDMSAHRSALITEGSLRSADLVVVMSVDQARAVRARRGARSPRLLVLGDLDPSPITRRTIADPWGGSDFAFDASYDRIDRCVRELVRIIQRPDES
jgi:protein-tyrosine-phosphatase